MWSIFESWSLPREAVAADVAATAISATAKTASEARPGQCLDIFSP
jgi:hypothetical protein